MGIGTGLGIALGAAADAYRKQTVFDTDQQYQKMLMANQQNEIDSRNKVQQQIQALAPPGVTQYQTGTDANGTPMWSTQAPASAAPAAPAATTGSPAPPASIAAPASTAAPASAMPSGATNAPPASIAAPPSPAQAQATQQAAAMPALAQASGASPIWSIPGTDSSTQGALPQTSSSVTPDQTQAATPTAPTVPSRVYSAQQRMLDIADIYMRSGVPSLISAAGEIQNNALNTQLTQQRIAAGDREAANAKLDYTLKQATTLLNAGETDAAMTTAISALPGMTGLHVETVNADGPNSEGKVVAKVYGPDHQYRYTIPGAFTPETFINKMRYGLLDPEAQAKTQLELAQGHLADASARNTTAAAVHEETYNRLGGAQEELNNLKARTQQAAAESGLLSSESGRISISNNALTKLQDPNLSKDERNTNLNTLKFISGIYPEAKITTDVNAPGGPQRIQTRTDVPVEDSVSVWDPSMNTWVPMGTQGADIAKTPDWQQGQITLGRDNKTNKVAYNVTADGQSFPTFREAYNYNQGWQKNHPKASDKSKGRVTGRTGDPLPTRSALPVRGNSSASDVGDTIHSGLNSFLDSLNGPQSSALGTAARFGQQ